jgi:hypothetical protein
LSDTAVLVLDLDAAVVPFVDAKAEVEVEFEATLLRAIDINELEGVLLTVGALALEPSSTLRPVCIALASSSTWASVTAVVTDLGLVEAAGRVVRATGVFPVTLPAVTLLSGTVVVVREAAAALDFREVRRVAVEAVEDGLVGESSIGCSTVRVRERVGGIAADEVILGLILSEDVASKIASLVAGLTEACARERVVRV